MKPGYRRAAVGVVGCLLVGGALGTGPHQGGAIAAAAQESPPAASRTTASFWEPQYEGNDGRGSAHILSTRLLRPESSAPRIPALETYKVQDGDTFSTIAEAYDTDIATLQALNTNVDATTLEPGVSLKVIKAFHGLTYTVQEGDTLESVAEAHGVEMADVRLANGLQLDAGLREGEMLFLPGARPRSRQLANRGSVSRTQTRSVAAATESRPVSEVAAAPAPAPKPAPAPAPKPAPAAAPAPAPAPKVASSGWVWPITGGDLSSTFGWRGDIGDFHEGIDIAVPAGTPAVATRSGVVEVSGWDGGYGMCVIIDHGDGTKSRYAHASALLVTVGEKVVQGQAVIKVGNTGHSTGNHLHFEVIVGGKPQNPLNYLP